MMLTIVNVVFFVLSVKLCSSIKCVGKSCLDIPLTDHLEAPLTAKLDISELNKQLVNLIEHEVEDAITNLLDNITNHRMISVEKKLTAEVQNSMALNVRGLNDTFEHLSSRLDDIFQWHSSGLEDKIEQQSSRLEDAFDKLSSELEKRVVRINESLRQEMLQQSENTVLNIQTQMKELQKAGLILYTSMMQMENRFLRNIADQNRRINTKTSGLSADISDIKRQVAVTSCVSDDGTYKSGQNIFFRDVKTSIGIQDISSFVSTGKFTCETAGIYLVMVTILTHDAVDAGYGIYKNTVRVVRVRDQQNVSLEHSSTAVAALVLRKGDSVYVQTFSSFFVHKYDSCITILQVK